MESGICQRSIRSNALGICFRSIGFAICPCIPASCAVVPIFIVAYSRISVNEFGYCFSAFSASARPSGSFLRQTYFILPAVKCSREKT